MIETIELTCANCGGPFRHPAARVRSYRKVWGRDPLYCSRKCWGAATHARNSAAARFICEECGADTPMRRYKYIDKKTGKPHSSTYVRKQRFCSQTCSYANARRLSAGRFLSGETGRHITTAGYARIVRPISINGKREPILEHREIMSRILGRPMRSDEQVHHINGQRADNRPENLELWTKRQPSGQRVADKVAFAIEILTLYPELAKARGYTLHYSETATVTPEAWASLDKIVRR